MNMVETSEILISIMPFIISVLIFWLIVLLAQTYQPNRIIRTYERVNKQLKEKKNVFFDYEKVKVFLTANGAKFYLGKWVEPIKYYAIRLVLAAVFFGIGLQFHWLLAVIFAFIGYHLLQFIIIYRNRKYNERMLPQIQTIYSALQIQIKAGVFVSDALAECYSRLEPGRLRTALEEVAGELFVKSSFESAITNLNRKFNNGFIDSLCIILLQAKETGKSAELLNDISYQLNDMNKTLLMKKRAALERTITFCLLGIVVAFMTVIMYVLVVDLFAIAGNL